MADGTAAVQKRTITPEHKAALVAGQRKAQARRKEMYLAGYDPTKSTYQNAQLAFVEYNCVRDWMRDDPDFGLMLRKKDEEYKAKVVSEIQTVCEQMAKGQFYCTTTYKNADGSVKQTAEYQQQPSYKHAELLLRAFDPGTYKPDSSGAQVSITISLSHSDGQGEEVSYIDITDDPGKAAGKALSLLD